MPPYRLRITITSGLVLLLLNACHTGQVRDVEPAASKQAPSLALPETKPERIRQQTTTRNNQWAVQSGPEAIEPPDDVWERIRAGLHLDRHLDQPAVRERLAWYSRHQGYLDRIAERATPYLYHIVSELEARGMPVELALLPVVESAYQPLAYSRMHASGLWQFIPATGERFGLKQNWWYDGRRDVYQATRAALDYLETLNNEFNGDWLHALAGYNWGEGNVARAISRNQAAGKPISFWDLRTPAETRGYIPALLAIAEIVARPEQYGVSLTPIANEPYFAKVDTGGQIDLAKAAELAAISEDKLKQLNPGFKRWATDPDGPHTLLVPIHRADQLAQQLRHLPAEQRLTWQRHRIGQGETLGAIAARYGTTVAVLQHTNNIRGHLIRAGNDLLIPGPGSAGAPPAELAATSSSEPATESDGGTHHTVRPGDTLWQIARRHGHSVAQLTATNGLRENTVLRPGQRLRLPAGGTRTVAATTPTGANDAQQRVHYTVRRGDSLWTISQRFQVNINSLREWNRLQQNAMLQPGQRLELYVDPDATPHGI